MISLIDRSVFGFLSEFFSEYGIKIPFSYDSDMDVLTEFRRSIRLRVENNAQYDKMVADTLGLLKKTSITGVYSRSPLTKSTLVGNNDRNRPLPALRNRTVSDVMIRHGAMSDVTYSVRIITNDNKLSDIVEMIYAIKLDSNNLSSDIVYKPSDKNSDYDSISSKLNLNFESISSSSSINNSDLKVLDFSVRATGLVILPYSTTEGLIENIEWSVSVGGDDVDKLDHEKNSDVSVSQVVRDKIYSRED